MKLPACRVVSQQSTKPADGARRAHSQRRQFLVTVLVNIATFVAGTIYGWAGPLLPVLQSEESAVGIPPITDVDASWLASIYCLSRLVTIPLYMYAIDRFGCKVTGYLVALPFLLSYTMLLFADSTSMLFWGRFICGIAAGGTGILAPSYTADIAEDNNKGKLNTFFAQSMNFGLTFAYVMGYYTSYVVFHVFCVVITIAFAVALFWLPESPMFLITSGKIEEAKEVLKWMRDDEASDFELERMKARAEEVLEKRNRKVSFSDLADRRMLRALFIVLGLTLNQQLTGVSPVEAYAVTIFQQAGSVIPPNITTILIGVLLIIGTHFSSIAVEKCGRRFLLIVSDVVVTLCLLAVGSYFYLQRCGWNVEYVGWLPVASILLYTLSNGLGIGVLPFTIATELVHPNYRSFVQTANVVMLSISTFVPTLTYVALVDLVGLHGCFWLYAACCAVGTVCIFLTVPETKNRSLEDVLDQMGSDSFIHSVLYYKKESKNKANHLSAAKTTVTQVTESA